MTALLAAQLRTCHGAFADGYTSEDIDTVLAPLSAYAGARFVAVWDYVDTWGTGGNSHLAGWDGEHWRWISAELDDHLGGHSDPGLLPAQVRACADAATARGLLLGGPMPPAAASSVRTGHVVGTNNVAQHRYDGEAPPFA